MSTGAHGVPGARPADIKEIARTGDGTGYL
jgi:hypothetical protein